jgi:hypothetical protein
MFTLQIVVGAHRMQHSLLHMCHEISYLIRKMRAGWEEVEEEPEDEERWCLREWKHTVKWRADNGETRQKEVVRLICSADKVVGRKRSKKQAAMAEALINGTCDIPELQHLWDKSRFVSA